MNSILEKRLLEITEMFVKNEIEAALGAMSELETQYLEPTDRSIILARYATFFHLLDLPDQELTALAQALSLNPENPRAQYLHAVHLMADERFDDAIHALMIAANTYAPDDATHLAEVYGNLSYCWLRMGDRDRSELYLEMSKDLDPNAMMEGEPDDEAIWPEDLEPEVQTAFEIPSDDILSRLDLDEIAKSSLPGSRVRSMVEALKISPKPRQKPLERHPAGADRRNSRPKKRSRH